MHMGSIQQQLMQPNAVALRQPVTHSVLSEKLMAGIHKAIVKEYSRQDMAVEQFHRPE